MNIAFDYDDTLDLAYELFSVITNSLISAGHKIYIITDIWEEYREYRTKQLKDHNIAFTELVITGNKFKACQDRKIEFIFDDCRDYFKGIAPVYLQVFSIPSPIKKTLKDKTKVEITVMSKFEHFSSSTRTSNYFYRYKVKRKWSEWLETPTQIKAEIEADLNRFNSISDLNLEWSLDPITSK